MSGRKKKIKRSPILGNIRKPVAPPAVRFGNEKAEEKAHPALRKIKHKNKRYEQSETDGDQG